MEDKFKSGDLVEILTPQEIIQTLDSRGTIHGLPFMAEMIAYCGKRYRVRSKIEKTCVVTGKMREFINDDVVYLENLRCDGSSHDGCQRGCLIFWNEAWLKKVDDDNDTNIDPIIEDASLLRSRLITKNSPDKYFCQSTQLSEATQKLSHTQRISKLAKEITSNTVGLLMGLKSIVFPLWWRLRFKKLIGGLAQTPISELNLQPGEIVEVKSFEEIKSTLDKKGRNRGLEFHYDMMQFCGKQYRVRNRLEKMISEASGKMLKIKNTVILEDVTCDFAYRFWGCSRCIFQYWREIWLKRIDNNRLQPK